MGSRIKALRNAKHLSQADLAAAVGIGQSAISKIERGETAEPETLRKIAQALDVDVSELTDDERDVPATGDAQPVPAMASVPGWDAVLATAQTIAPHVDAESWSILERSPGLLSSDVPLTPAVVAALAEIVQRHRPLRKK